MTASSLRRRRRRRQRIFFRFDNARGREDIRRRWGWETISSGSIFAAAAPWRHRRLIRRRRRRVLEAEALCDVRLELLVGVRLVGWHGGDPLLCPLQQVLLGLAAAAVLLLVVRLGGKAAFEAEITGLFVVFLFLSRVGLGGSGELFASVLLATSKI